MLLPYLYCYISVYCFDFTQKINIKFYFKMHLTLRIFCDILILQCDLQVTLNISILCIELYFLINNCNILCKKELFPVQRKQLFFCFSNNCYKVSSLTISNLILIASRQYSNKSDSKYANIAVGK